MLLYCPCLDTCALACLTTLAVFCSAEEVEKTRQKAAEQEKLSRKVASSASHNGLEGAALKISETTGSILMSGTAQAGGPDGGSTVTKKSKKDRREKRDKRREKEGRQGAETLAPRPSKSKKGSSSKRRPKVGA